MDYMKEKLKERILLFLYVMSLYAEKINMNTFKRYLYLYYLSENFFTKKDEEIVISIDKSDIKIPYFEQVLDDLCLLEFIDVFENSIILNEALTNNVEKMLGGNGGETGEFYELYRQIKPFVNLLKSYDDQFVFTIFFSEPTFREASDRGIDKLKSSSSVLTKLLNQFKKKLDNDNVDNYDILTYWMDFVLKNYYKLGEGNVTNE
ncbi:hypothetical protein SAMN02746066_04265 [Anaerosporobacter mobilis DSM 15930]|jgi:hypothetical protein|uniref:Uncharacterized protein n=1 Tax=Anaerosporobacter mobilis DSM 15930 TaxID=1120996 RepID=A0A1M7N806_9FIRM|nr:hypothetical protein [Anaerosporobacter mobilis]SHM99190.1 hypothetical protein SAMN02746066_04265 [Anaerosporobacter mobilis DSM 15930]